MIQLGSIFAVMWLYRAKIVDMLTGLGSKPEARHFALAIIVATLPALAAGAAFSGPVKRVLYAKPLVPAITFIVGGIVMLIVERTRREPDVVDAERIPLGRALGIGMCQALALVPGVSRSGATIVSGLVFGLARPAAAEFSFFLAMPVVIAGFAHDFVDVAPHLSPARGMEIATGLAFAFLSSLLIIRPFLGFVRRAGFAPFAWYRIALGLVLCAVIAAGWMPQ